MGIEMNNVRFDLHALQNSTNCLKKAAYKTDLKIVEIDKIKYIQFRSYCKFFLLGRLISYIRYWLYSADNINKQIQEVVETHKNYAIATVYNLFSVNLSENKLLNIQQYVGIVDGLLNQSGIVEPISFEKTFVKRFHQLFPEETIAQLAEAVAANRQSPEQITLIAKSQRLIQMTDLFKINCVESNKIKTALLTPKSKPTPQEKESLQDRQATLSKDDFIEKETESVDDSSEEELEIEGDDIFSEDELLSPKSDSVEESVDENVNVPKAENNASEVLLDDLIEKAESMIKRLLNKEIEDKEQITQVQTEIEEIRKQVENTKSTISFLAIFQKWIDEHFTQTDTKEIKNAYSTGQFSKELNAKIKKLDAYSLMKQLDKDYIYPPFEEIETVRVAYKQLKEILSQYHNNYDLKKYINYIDRLLKWFSNLESCPDLQTSIPQDFLALVEQIEQKIEKSAWESLPAIKKQHDKLVEFATFYKGLRCLENVSLADAQKQSTCQIEISIGITTDRGLSDSLKKQIYDNYNQSFGYWKVGDHHQLKCTFQFAEKDKKKGGQAIKKEDSSIYDLLLAPIYYGSGRMEISDLNNNITDYIGSSYLREHKLKWDGFATILLICGREFDRPEWFKGKEHYPRELTGQVRDRTIFMSCKTDTEDPHWKNDTTFKEKIKQILIKKACVEKAKSLLQAQ